MLYIECVYRNKITVNISNSYGPRPSCQRLNLTHYCKNISTIPAMAPVQAAKPSRTFSNGLSPSYYTTLQSQPPLFSVFPSTYHSLRKPDRPGEGWFLNGAGPTTNGPYLCQSPSPSPSPLSLVVWI